MKCMISKYRLFKINKYLFVLIIMVLNVCCTTGFDSFNTNPNEATDDMLDWDNTRTGAFFLQMQQNVLPIAQGVDFGSSVYQVVETMTGDGYVGYFGFPAPDINSASRYNWKNRNWPGMMFTTAYSKTMNAWRELKRAIQDETDPRYAIAQILKVATMHRVTDTYGPIPYVKFGESKEVPYDSQKDIYYKFFEELNNAVLVLDSYASSGKKVFSAWDCVYSGDVKSWVRFANSLRLRLAMHIAYVDPDKAQQEVKMAVNNSHGLMVDVAELKHIAPIATYESPLHIIKSWDDICMGATLDSYMNGYKDPRLSAYFDETSDGLYRGIRAGMSSSTPKSSYTTGLFSTPKTTATSNVVWMRASESYFLLAEAALRNWVDGDPKTFYENGVKASFQEYGVSGIDDYLKNSIDKPIKYTDPVTPGHSINARGDITVAWNDSDSDEKKLERIITQKYIALFPIGQEAWTEYRRTGYPKVFPVVVNESNGGCVDTELQIRRLPYPVSEYDTNNKALQEGIKLLGGVDNAGVRLWWDCNGK